MANFTHAEALKRLYPPVSYDVNGERFIVQCEVDGRCFDRLQASAEAVLAAVEPATSRTMLADWERVLSLDIQNKNYQERVALVIAKLNEVGGLSIPYFIAIAESAGYQIKILERQPFRAGTSRCKENLEIADAIYSWRVMVASKSKQLFLFRAGLSMSGEGLSSYGDILIEKMFDELKPAHTFVSFEYGE